MKELSTQEKAKANNEAYKKVADRFGSDVADEIFTECKESYGERIRKAMISGMAALKEQGKETFATIPLNDCIGWLEKEGEQILVNTDLDELVIQLEETIGTSPHSRETIKDFFQKAVQKYMNCLKIANGEIGSLVEENYRLKENQGEQKPADEVEPKFHEGDKIRKKAPRSFDRDMEVARVDKGYYICNHIGKFSSEPIPFSEESSYELIEQKAANEVEPKFHEGDWIVFNGCILFIKEVVQGYYRTISVIGIPNSYDWDIDNVARLWTIEDARDGEVLACNEEILLFKSYSVRGRISVYCWYNGRTNNFHNKEVVNALMTTRNKICPATKEQEDLFFQKMKEAGYEWDAEKNGPKKIEPKFHEGDWCIDKEDGVIFQIVKVLDNTYTYRTNERKEYSCTHYSLENDARLWTIEDAKPGDVLAAHECLVLFREIDGLNIRCYCTYHFMNYPSFYVDTLQNKDAFHPATKEQRDALMKAMSDAGFTFDFDKIEPKFHEGDWIVTPENKVLQITSIVGTSYRFNNESHYLLIRYCDEKCRLWTIEDAKDGDVICYKDEISLYKHDIKNCTKQGTNFGGFVYYCCYDGKRFIVDSLYSLIEQDKMDIHPASKEERNLLFSKMKEAGYEKKKPKKISN